MKHPNNKNDKKKYDQLFQQIKSCYLFDQYPIKKELSKALRLLKQIPGAKKHQKSSSNGIIEKKTNHIFLSCQNKIEKSQAKIQQRKKFLPEPEFPQQLPVSKKLLEIQSMMQKHQLIVIAGETGSGKTTQIPKIALSIGRGISGQIAHTQPRKIS